MPDAAVDVPDAALVLEAVEDAPEPDPDSDADPELVLVLVLVLVFVFGTPVPVPMMVDTGVPSGVVVPSSTMPPPV